MHSGPHSDRRELGHVHPSIPTSASNSWVHSRLAGLKDIWGKADVTLGSGPVWDAAAASSVSALQLFKHQQLPLSPCICVALCLSLFKKRETKSESVLLARVHMLTYTQLALKPNTVHSGEDPGETEIHSSHRSHCSLCCLSSDSMTARAWVIKSHASTFSLLSSHRDRKAILSKNAIIRMCHTTQSLCSRHYKIVSNE